MTLGPLDLPGPEFLRFYLVLLAGTVIAGFIIPRWLRPDGRARRVTDPDELAVLAGGPIRFAEAVVARLLASDVLSLFEKDRFHVLARPDRTGTAEGKLLALPTPIRWRAIERTLKPSASAIADRLVAGGQMLDPAQVWQMRLCATLPYLMLLPFGLAKLQIGIARDRPVEHLGALLALTAVFALLRFASVDKRTRAGIAALREAQRDADRLRRAAPRDEMGLAVALFGTAVLAGSYFGAFHALRSSSGDGGSSGSDGGDGGCGGGGCGGCS
jgi:uncharacterized protein (TIGR04222 family)